MIKANDVKENNKVIITKLAETTETFSICKNLISKRLIKLHIIMGENWLRMKFKDWLHIK
jgi:hypothetical protein